MRSPSPAFAPPLSAYTPSPRLHLYSMSAAPPPPTAPATFTLDPSITYPETIFDPSTCLRKGFCAVAKSEKRAPAPHNLYYGKHWSDLARTTARERSDEWFTRRTELHGDSDPKAKRLVFIMGLNNSSFVRSSLLTFSFCLSSQLTPNAPPGLAQPSLPLRLGRRLPTPRARQPRRREFGYAERAV